MGPKNIARLDPNKVLSKISHTKKPKPYQLSFEQEVARKRKKILDSKALTESEKPKIFDSPSRSNTQLEASESVSQETNKRRTASQTSSSSNVRPKITLNTPRKSTRASSLLIEDKNVSLSEENSSLPHSEAFSPQHISLGQQNAFIFNSIFSSEYAQILLKHYSEDSDLAALEFSILKSPVSVKSTFDSLYQLLNSHEEELLKKFSRKSLFFLRCEDFRDFLRNLKRTLISSPTKPDILSTKSLSDEMAQVRQFAPSSESMLYSLRIGSLKEFQFPDREIKNPIYNLHLPIFNWLEKKLNANAFEGDEGSIKVLDYETTTVARIYITGDRYIIENSLSDPSSVILINVLLNTSSQVNSFLLLVRPFGDLHRMDACSTGNVSSFPKAWFWGKIIKCLKFSSGFQPGKVSYKPVLIGRSDSDVPDQFKSMVDAYNKFL